MARQPKPSKSDLAQSNAAAEALDKVQRHRPRWDDYVAAGVIDRVPEPGEDGKVVAKVRGHEKVVRMMQMNEEANNLAAWHGDNRAESPQRRAKREEQAEVAARKHHRARASIVHPGLPWKKEA